MPLLGPGHALCSRVQTHDHEETGEWEVGPEIYYVGIIDILQSFNTRKKAEYFFGGMNRNASCLPPDQYKDRFVKFIEEHSV